MGWLWGGEERESGGGGGEVGAVAVDIFRGFSELRFVLFGAVGNERSLLACGGLQEQNSRYI